MSLGENIYKLRTGKKLSQEDFAAAMEVSRQSVSKWENDMAVPELEKLIKMAKLFEVSLDELVGIFPTPLKKGSVYEARPVSTTSPGITAEELISIILLVLAILTPFIFMIFNTWFYTPLHITLGLLPPVATVISSHLVTKHKWMFGVYLCFHVFLSFLLLTSVWEGFWFTLLNIACMIYWHIRRK